MSDTPSRIGGYPVEREVGRGGMGVVYLARDPRLDRPVAIKVLPDAFAADPERLARFEREAKILASLRHPGIAGIHSLEEDGGRRFLTMEYVEGPTLAERLAHGALPVSDALDVCRQIAAALEAAHESGVVHRDLKPGNVKLTPAGEVKVLDFGLARGAAPAPGDSDLSRSPTLVFGATEAGVILGTAAYMSPEQARGRLVDRRADIWSFGCVLYECLTGRAAFAGETVSDTLARILEREPDLRSLPAGTPARVRELLVRCLEKDAKRRLRDIGEARIVLEELLASRTPSGRFPAAAAAAGEGGRRSGARLALAGGAALAGLVLGAALWMLLAPRAGGGGEVRCVSVELPSDLNITFPSISYDGRRIGFTGFPKNLPGGETPVSHYYLRGLSSFEFKPLSGTEGMLGGLESPDGHWLYFVASSAPGGSRIRLFRVPVDASAPPTAIADWGPTSNVITFLEGGDVLISDSRSFYRVPRGGGAPGKAIRTDVGRPGVARCILQFWPLPHDRAVPVDVVSYAGGVYKTGVGMLDPANGKVKMVEEDGGSALYVPGGYLLFARGDQLMAVRFDTDRLEAHGAPVAVWSGLYTTSAYTPAHFQVSRDGALFYRPGGVSGGREVAFLDGNGGITPWSSERWRLSGYVYPSPDGRSVATTITNDQAIDEIWISPLDHPAWRRLGSDPTADCGMLVWSPDGSQLAYRRTGRDDRDGIYVQPVAGGAARLVLKPPSDDIVYNPVVWLPGGRTLLVVRGSPTSENLALLPLEGGSTDPGRLRPLAQDKFVRTSPRLSPDGRWLAYVTDESGRNQVVVAELRPDGTLGAPLQASTAGGRLPAWLEGGRSLVFEDDANRMVRVGVTTKGGLAISAPVVVAEMAKLRVVSWSALPGGRLLAVRRPEGEDDLTRCDLVLNWTTELERRMKAAR